MFVSYFMPLKKMATDSRNPENFATLRIKNIGIAKVKC